MTVKQLFRCIGYENLYKVRLLKTSGKEVAIIAVLEQANRQYLFEGEIRDFVYDFQTYKVKSAQHTPVLTESNGLGIWLDIVITYDSKEAKLEKEKQQHREVAKKEQRKKERKQAAAEAKRCKKRKAIEKDKREENPFRKFD